MIFRKMMEIIIFPRYTRLAVRQFQTLCREVIIKTPQKVNVVGIVRGFRSEYFLERAVENEMEPDHYIDPCRYR